LGTDAAVAAIRARDLEALRAAVKGVPSARAMLAAGGAAWLTGLQWLHSRGGDLNAMYRGYRPLHSLIQEDAPPASEKAPAERMACLEWMLANSADPELLGAWPAARALPVAAFMGCTEYVEKLQAAGAAMDDFVAACLGDLRRVRTVLAKRPGFATERDRNGMTALQYAAGSRIEQEKCCEIARLLVVAGADPGVTVQSWRHQVDTLYFAGSSKNACVFELLLTRGANPHQALTIAMWNGNQELVDLAMLHGAVPDKATADGQPLLNHLIRWGRIEQALWLLGQGANPNIPDAKGWTAVDQAKSRGNARMLKAVMAAGGRRIK